MCMDLTPSRRHGVSRSLMSKEKLTLLNLNV
jgi:hypothetical protein